MSFDYVLLINADGENIAGEKVSIQTVVFRPLGGKQMIAQRYRDEDASRSQSWVAALVDIADLDPKYRDEAASHDGKTNVAHFDHAVLDGVAASKAKIGFNQYASQPKDVLVEGRLNFQNVKVRTMGYVPMSHDELAGIWSTAKITGTAAQRLNKCESDIPTNGGDKITNPSQRVDNWLTANPAMNTSKWGDCIWPRPPRGEYGFGVYDGKAVGAAAGEKFTEKRTFDKTYTRPNGDVYYGRSIGEHDDVDVMTKAREHNENVLLFGPPGTGKTALAEAAYMDNGEHGMVTILGTAETEVADFVGSYTQRPGEGFVWVDGPLIEAMENGKVLLVDEIGLIDPKVLSVLYSVMDGRGELKVTQNPDRGTVTAKDGFYVIAATNPHAPGVQLSEALISRFTIQVEVDSDYELAQHLKVNKAVVKAAETMDRRRRTGDMLWAPQLRELFAFKRNESIFGTTFAARSLVAGSPEIDRDTVADIIG